MQNPPPNPPPYSPNDMPPYSQPYQRPTYAPYPPSQDNSTAIVLEAVCSVFGIYGIGWLYRGHVGIGVALLALGFAWIAFAAIVTVVTLGFGLLCLGPLHVLLIVGDVLMLNNSLRQPWQR